MYEKITDESSRIEKVQKLKQKILSEIDNFLSRYRKRMSKNIDNKSFEFYVKRSFTLLELKQYIEDEYCFMSYESKDYNKDIVVYVIPDKNLNIWLQEDYSFTINFLTRAESVNYDVFQLLNDRYFGYNFTNICESILYDKKQNKIA